MNIGDLKIIPVSPDGSVDLIDVCAGRIADVREDCVEVEVMDGGKQLPFSLFIGVADQDGKRLFLPVEVESSSRRNETSVLTVSSGGQGKFILEPEKLRPNFNPDECRFEFEIPQSVLEDCVRCDVLDRVFCDRINVCPKCGSLPTYRLACGRCGSARVVREELIHHYACAHVGVSETFEYEGSLRCPKCKTEKMVVGSDFEYLEGQDHCLDCGWKNSRLEMIAHCMKCSNRFPASESDVQDVFCYQSNHLEWGELLKALQAL